MHASLPAALCAGLVAVAALVAAPLAAQSEGRAAAAIVPDTAATKASLLSADSALALAVERHGAERFLAAVDSDAAILFWGHPRVLVGGAEARVPFIERYGGRARYRWRPAHAIASADGRFGCTIGFSRFVPASDSTREVRRGAYATCWRRDGRGRWRIVGHQRRDSPVPELLPEGAEQLRTAPHSATAATGDDQLEQMLLAEANFATRAMEPDGPGSAFSGFIAGDGVLFGVPGLPTGPDEARQTFEAFTGQRAIVWVPLRFVGAAQGGLGFTVGYSMGVARMGRTGSAPNYGKFFTIWRQEPGGTWKYVVDLGSPRP